MPGGVLKHLSVQTTNTGEIKRALGEPSNCVEQFLRRKADCQPSGLLCKADASGELGRTRFDYGGKWLKSEQAIRTFKMRSKGSGPCVR